MDGFTPDEVKKWLEAEIALKTVELMEKNLDLEAALKRLDLLDKTKNEFLQIISHEIRTPLNGIKGTLYLLKEMIATPEQQEFFKMLENSISRLDHFAFTALQIAQLQTTSRSLEKQQVPLDKIMHDLSAFRNPESSPVRFTENIAPGIITLPVNRSLFLTALLKIYRNAIRFSPVGGLVMMKLTKEEEGFHFMILDEGPGFTEPVLLNKFEPFVTGETHVDDNPGLSLMLVKYIIEAHGGKVDIYNRESGGAVVDFFIP